MMTDDGRDHIIQRRQMTDDTDGSFYMSFDDLIFLIRKLCRLIQDRLRNTDLSDIMEKSRLTDHLYDIRIQMQCLCKLGSIIRHIFGMLEGIMVLCINRCCQGIDRGFIFLINMLMIGLAFLP